MGIRNPPTSNMENTKKQQVNAYRSISTKDIYLAEKSNFNSKKKK